MAQICETCKKKGDRCYCAPNSTCEAYEPEINMNPKNPQVEKILSIDIKVLCDDGKERIFSIYDMVDVVKSDMSLSKDLTTNPRCKIRLDLHCDDYRWLIKEDKAVAPTYPEYVPKEYRMPDFVPPIEITCNTKNPYTIKCSSDCKQTENN